MWTGDGKTCEGKVFQNFNSTVSQSNFKMLMSARPTTNAMNMLLVSTKSPVIHVIVIKATRAMDIFVLISTNALQLTSAASLKLDHALILRDHTNANVKKGLN